MCNLQVATIREKREPSSSNVLGHKIWHVLLANAYLCADAVWLWLHHKASNSKCLDFHERLWGPSVWVPSLSASILSFSQMRECRLCTRIAVPCWSWLQVVTIFGLACRFPTLKASRRESTNGHGNHELFVVVVSSKSHTYVPWPRWILSLFGRNPFNLLANC